MVGAGELLGTILLVHSLPFAFVLTRMYTSIPVGLKAYFLGQAVATVLVFRVILSSVTSVAGAVTAYFAIFQELLTVAGVFLAGLLLWSSGEMASSGTNWNFDLSGSALEPFARPERRILRGPLVRGSVVVAVFVLALVLARVFSVVLPSLPPAGVSLSSAPKVAVLQSELFYDYEFAVKLIKVVRLDLYLVVGAIGLLASLSNRMNPKNLKYSYILIGGVSQVVVLPVAVLSVFGVTLFGVTLVPPFAPATLTDNVPAVAAPVFLLLLVVGLVTREFLRKAEHTYDS